MHVDLVKEAAFSGLQGFVHLWVEFNLLDHLWQFSLPERREKDVKIFLSLRWNCTYLVFATWDQLMKFTAAAVHKLLSKLQDGYWDLWNAAKVISSQNSDSLSGGFHVLLSRSVEKRSTSTHTGVVALLIYIMIILHIVWHWLYKQNSTSQDADESSEDL
jgi:hypothetical protein